MPLASRRCVRGLLLRGCQAENEELRQGQMALAGELKNLRQQLAALQARFFSEPLPIPDRLFVLSITRCRAAAPAQLITWQDATGVLASFFASVCLSVDDHCLAGARR